KVECWADYQSAGGPNFCVPFLVTNKGYGLLWDNPSKTTILPGFNEQTKWISQVGQRVSFFVVAGATTDELYGRYTDAAQVGLWADPVQAAVYNTGRDAFCGTWLSRAPSADRYAGVGLVL